MMETKLALMERLRKEKRWAEADKFRETTRERLRSEGMRREQAREEAWRLMAEKYPALVTAVASPTTPVKPPLNNVEERIESELHAFRHQRTGNRRSVRWHGAANMLNPKYVELSEKLRRPCCHSGAAVQESIHPKLIGYGDWGSRISIGPKTRSSFAVPRQSTYPVKGFESSRCSPNC